MISLLQRTRSSAEALARKAAAHPSYAPPLCSAQVRTQELSLPAPQPLTSDLIALGIRGGPAREISAVVMRAAQNMKTTLERTYEERRPHIQAQSRQDPKIPFLVSSLYRSFYTLALEQWKQYLLEKLTPRVLRIRATQVRREGQSSVGNSTKRTFNQRAVPVLEAFFKENAFPSRLEKYELAFKCEMDYRQIHVWFQNRRSRSRKEGKPLQKRETSGPLVEIHDAVVNALLPPEPVENECFDETCDPSNPIRSGDCALDPAAPQHAFPSPYPPLCAYDPFPVTKEKRGLLLPWIRPAPSTVSAHNPPTSVVEVTELITAFGRLTISETAVERQATHLPNFARPTCVQTTSIPVGFVTPCVRAPLPSLIGAGSSKSASQGGSSCHCPPASPRISHNTSVRSPDAAGDIVADPLPISPSTTTCRQPRRGLPRRLPKGAPRSPKGESRTVFPWADVDRAVTRSPSTKSSSSRSVSSASEASPLPTPSLPVTALPTDVRLGDAVTCGGHVEGSLPFMSSMLNSYCIAVPDFLRVASPKGDVTAANASMDLIQYLTSLRPIRSL
ncbi:hypothetical protein OH77DRAFT_426887 [Trametes cingulata]|nr:hypothetical protein OH77DRAFT_426887 [Trametes cingulata]